MGVDFMEWLRRVGPKKSDAPWWEYSSAWPGLPGVAMEENTDATPTEHQSKDNK